MAIFAYFQQKTQKMASKKTSFLTKKGAILGQKWPKKGQNGHFIENSKKRKRAQEEGYKMNQKKAKNGHFVKKRPKNS